MTRILLDKHETILQYRFLDSSERVDVATRVSGVRAGLEHLHS